MAISANLNVDERNVLARCTEAIPNATNRMDERVSLLVIDLATDTPDIDIDDVGRRVKMKIPNVLQQHRPRDDPTFIANQVLKQLEFAGKQTDIPATPAGGSRYEIQLEIPDTQHRFLNDRVAASSKCFNTRQQLHEREWLGKVIIAAGAQPTHSIVNLAKRTDDQNRGDDASLSQAAHDLNSIDVRKHAINRYHRIISGKSKTQRIAAIDSYVHLIAVCRQRLYELTCCLLVVFNDKNVPVPCYHDCASPRTIKGIQIYVTITRNHQR